MMERAELPVQRNSTLNGCSFTAASRATGGRGARRGLRHATRLGINFGMGHAGFVFAAAVAVVGAVASGVESLPGDTRRIVDPRFLRLGVAAGGLALLDDGATGLF